jgi:hypothetical protein
MAEKIYYLSDLERIKTIAAEMGLKAWKLENLSGAELQKPNPAIKTPEALERIFNYLKSEVIPDGKYLLIGKTGHKSIHRTEIYIQKGAEAPPVNNSLSLGLAYADYSEVMKQNAKLQAENYYFSEQIKVLNEQIAELRAIIDQDDDDDDQDEKTDIYKDLAKEYAPQLINIFTQYLSPQSKSAQVVNFADPAPSAPPQKITRFTDEYFNFWRNCTDQEAVNREYSYLQNNRPDKLEAFTSIFTGNE